MEEVRFSLRLPKSLDEKIEVTLQQIKDKEFVEFSKNSFIIQAIKEKLKTNNRMVLG